MSRKQLKSLQDIARVLERDEASGKRRNEQIIALAREQWHKDGQVEVDEGSLISEGDDNGAYVQAWVWVDFSSTPLDKEAEI